MVVVEYAGRFEGMTAYSKWVVYAPYEGLKIVQLVPNIRRETGFRVVQKKFSTNVELLQKLCVAREQLKEIHVGREQVIQIQRNFGRTIQYLKLRGSPSKGGENADCEIHTPTVHQL